MTTPSRNIFWKDVASATDEVEERKNLFVVHRNGVPFAVTYWEGRSARQAQEFLKSISFALCSHEGCNIRVRKLGDECGNHE